MMKLTEVRCVIPDTSRNVVKIVMTAISNGSTATADAKTKASTSSAPTAPSSVSTSTLGPPPPLPVDPEGAQHLQVCFVGGLARNRQPLCQLVADAQRCERAGGSQAKPEENDELLVVQRPTSDSAHGDSFDRRGQLDARPPRLRRR